jgi:hypothetical protein
MSKFEPEGKSGTVTFFPGAGTIGSRLFRHPPELLELAIAVGSLSAALDRINLTGVEPQVLWRYDQGHALSLAQARWHHECAASTLHRLAEELLEADQP